MKTIILVTILVMVTACGKKNTDSSIHSAQPLTQSEKLTVKQCVLNGQIAVRNDQDEIVKCADSCAQFKKKIPSDWFQKTIEVPEDPENQAGRKIKIFYYGKINPGSTPAIFFNGGPAASSHSSFSLFLKEQKVVDSKGKISLIYIDQRGNGCSSFYPQGSDSETIERLRHYGSTGIVADAEAVRRELLGTKPWISFGQSYGGFISHRYYKNFPQSLIAGVSHGNTLNNNGFSRIKERIRSQIKVMDAYFTTYPGDLKVFMALKRELKENVCIADPEKINGKHCGSEIIDGVMGWLGFHDEWPDLHSQIEKMLNLDGSLNWSAITDFDVMNTRYTNPNNRSSIAFHILEVVDRNVPPENYPNCAKIRSEILQEQGLDISDYNTECSTTLQFKYSPGLSLYQDLKKDLLLTEDFVSALKENPSIPFFVYSGELDPYLPKENFVEEVTQSNVFPNFHYHHFMFSGHDGFYSEQKVWQDMIDSSIKGQLFDLADSP